MTTLHVVVDTLASNSPGELRNYTADLTHALIRTAPIGCDVAGMVNTTSNGAQVAALLPGLAGIGTMNLSDRELSHHHWHIGHHPVINGMIHAPDLRAPLHRHEHEGDHQTVVTIHDLLAWTHPRSLSSATASRDKVLLKRARKFADAIVAPSHALARQLNEIHDFGDRVRVIEPAGSTGLVLPQNAEQRATELGLPAEYILTVGRGDARSGIPALLAGLARLSGIELPILVLGMSPEGARAVASRAGIAAERVHSVQHISESDRAVLLSHASVFVHPSLEEGSGVRLVEAFRCGVPAVHSDAPALLETAIDSGVAVPREDSAGYPDRLGEAVRSVLDDEQLAARLRIAGSDRAHAFSWTDTATRVWELHADL